MISESTEEHVEAEVVALGINLACHPLNAQKMAEGPGLAVLVRRAVTTRDHLLLKMVRNITQHEDQRLKRLFLVTHPLKATTDHTHQMLLLTKPSDYYY